MDIDPGDQMDTMPAGHQIKIRQVLDELRLQRLNCGRHVVY